MGLGQAYSACLWLKSNHTVRAEMILPYGRITMTLNMSDFYTTIHHGSLYSEENQGMCTTEHACWYWMRVRVIFVPIVVLTVCLFLAMLVMWLSTNNNYPVKYLNIHLWIGTKFGTDMHGSQWMKLNNFWGPLTLSIPIMRLTFLLQSGWTEIIWGIS